MYILNKSGPKTDPCGTPSFNSAHELKRLIDFSPLSSLCKITTK